MSAATSRHCHETVETRRRTNVRNWLTNREERFARRVERMAAGLDDLKAEHADAKPRSKARGALSRQMKDLSRRLKRTAGRRQWCARQLQRMEEIEKAEQLARPGPIMARRTTLDEIHRATDSAVFNFLRDTGLFGKALGEAKQARG